ncbi:MAG: bifunctional glycosyltransferase family 2/GtrA family protein [Bryobacteraceae bacterium]|nr:bifunctional glycosyltransferase family 2/GtrA family protein [Bryobacteraceae bacterium]
MQAKSGLPPVLIPAYRPSEELVRLATNLAARGFERLIVIDDGSGPDCAPVFVRVERLPGVTLLRHETNRGKGEALKTGLRYVLREMADAQGVVTADADGQHLPEDIERVARRLAGSGGSALVLGARRFDRSVPLRSRIGNLFSIHAVRWIAGMRLADTQTGLRGIPRALAERLVEAPAGGYEFELDMLLAARHCGFPIAEEPIRTVYLEGNRSSHFHPLRDSMKIYFVLFRFTLVSLVTALIDNSVFALALSHALPFPAAQVLARLSALSFQYPAARRAVFHSREPHHGTLPKFLLVAFGHALASYACIHWLAAAWGGGWMPAKIAVESCLFPLNFLLQRDWVFMARPRQGAVR